MLWLLLAVWAAATMGTLLYYRRDLLALWREPVLRFPVLIIESDDWGAGPVDAQATALHQLADLLQRHRDHAGRHPVMTLALVLAVPDGPAIREDGRYHRLTLDNAMFAPVRAAIERGCAAGVFAVQLHGLEHYWPAALMASADPKVRAWMEGQPPAMTEQLPSHLQSRWVDASVLPSRPLPAAEIERAVAEEVAVFERAFGSRPRVVVPPTFVWNADVEKAWARHGVEFVVTPGLRSACREATGLPGCDGAPLRNAERGEGTYYIVRNDYFEPERGHVADHGLSALDQKWEQRRPCLLETHRSNFLRGEPGCSAAMDVIQDLLARAIVRYPSLRFVATAELGDILRSRDPHWVEAAFGRRLAAWCARLRETPGFRRWAKLTGIYWLLKLPRVAG